MATARVRPFTTLVPRSRPRRHLRVALRRWQLVSGIRNDNWLARTNSIARYGALIEAGAELHEYNRLRPSRYVRIAG